MSDEDEDYGQEYYLDPTPEQITLIGELIDQLPSGEINRLWRAPGGWASGLDFWLKNWGRAEDLITDLERILNKEGTYLNGAFNGTNRRRHIPILILGSAWESGQRTAHTETGG